MGCKNREAKGEEHPFTNELVYETSPYLLQHAHNPVNWLPWGEKALEKAREEEKLIIVSIGYSSCHWCHVMEEETFEDVEVADLMNENFISIKVESELIVLILIRIGLFTFSLDIYLISSFI